MMKTTFFITLTVLALLISCNNNDDNGNSNRIDNECLTNTEGLYPEQSTSKYNLPWSFGETFEVSQGNCTTGSHKVAFNQQFAYDFAMPFGINIRAARGGEVIVAEESFADNTGVPGEENYISILHDDGSVARYVHIKQNGILVELGVQVEQGDIIAISGNSGNSTGPHLHFDVINGNCSPQVIDCETQPTTFKNTSPHENGLEEHVAYTAQNNG